MKVSYVMVSISNKAYCATSNRIQLYLVTAMLVGVIFQILQICFGCGIWKEQLIVLILCLHFARRKIACIIIKNLTKTAMYNIFYAVSLVLMNFHCWFMHCWLYQVQGAVFDLPEEIAKDLLNMELPPGNTLAKISKVFFAAHLLKVVMDNLCHEIHTDVYFDGLSCHTLQHVLKLLTEMNMN